MAEYVGDLPELLQTELDDALLRVFKSEGGGFQNARMTGAQLLAWLAGSGGSILVADNFPAIDPADGALLLFNDGQTTFTAGKTVRNDADTADVTSASQGDWFKYFATGTKWVRQVEGGGILLTEAQITDAASTVPGLTSGQREKQATLAHESNPFDVILAPKEYVTQANLISASREDQFAINAAGDTIFITANDHDELFIASLLQNGDGAILEGADHHEVIRFSVRSDAPGSSQILVSGFPDNWQSLLTIGNQYELGFTQGRPDIWTTSDDVEEQIEQDVQAFARDPAISVPRSKFYYAPIHWGADVYHLDGRDFTNTDNSANFSVHTAGGQDFILFQNGGDDQGFFDGLEIYTTIGIFEDNTLNLLRSYIITGSRHVTNGYPVELLGRDFGASDTIDGDLFELRFAEPSPQIISQADAEAGIATRRHTVTAQRLFQSARAALPAMSAIEGGLGTETIARSITAAVLRNTIRAIGPKVEHLLASQVTHTSDAIALTPTHTITAYFQELIYIFRTKIANTGAITVNVDSVGARALVKADGSAFASGDLAAGVTIPIVFDTDNSRFVAYTQ